MLSDDFFDVVGVVVKGVVCDDIDEVFIVVMMFGGRGIGDCLEGIGVGILVGLCVLDIVFVSLSMVCLSGGGGFEVFEELGYLF